MAEYIVDATGYIEEYEIANGAEWAKEEVVRCRDCKHSNPLSNFHKHLGCYNDFLNSYEAIPVCDDGFCAWGERKEGGNG